MKILIITVYVLQLSLFEFGGNLSFFIFCYIFQRMNRNSTKYLCKKIVVLHKSLYAVLQDFFSSNFGCIRINVRDLPLFRYYGLTLLKSFRFFLWLHIVLKCQIHFQKLHDCSDCYFWNSKRIHVTSNLVYFV